MPVTGQNLDSVADPALTVTAICKSSGEEITTMKGVKHGLRILPILSIRVEQKAQCDIETCFHRSVKWNHRKECSATLQTSLGSCLMPVAQ